MTIFDLAAIDCEVGGYAAISCNVSCGGGVGFLQRQITVEPANNGSECTATQLAIMTGSCNTQPCPIDCVASWGGWGSCSASCGLGMMSIAFMMLQ